MKLVKILVGFRAHRSHWSIIRNLGSEAPKSFKDIPGLTCLPIIGTLHHFLPYIGSVGVQKNISSIYSVLNEKYGSIVKWEGMMGREDMVVFFEPKDYEKVHRAEDSNPTRPSFDPLEYYRVVQNKQKYEGIYGLSTAQGVEWREFRTKVNPAIMKVKLRSLYTSAFEEIAEDSIARLLKMDSTALTEDFDSEMTRWSVETISYVSLGDRVGCLENHSAEHSSNKLLQCAREIPDLTFQLMFSPQIWKKDKSNTPVFKKILEVLDVQFQISEKYVTEAKNKIEARGPIPEADQSILEKLLALDYKVAVMMANEMIIAGIDTVAFTTTGLIYQLATHPEIQEKVRQEFLENKSTRLFKACLKESLRMSSVVPSSMRVTTQEHVVQGYRIPKGVFAVIPNEVLSKSEKHYPRANEFLPERWLVDRSHPLYHGNTHPMVTLPFGFGVRACIGRRVAELEVEVFMRKLLEKVRVTWSGPPIQNTTKLMNTYSKPFNFKFEVIE